MTFAEWKSLSRRDPVAAARKITTRIASIPEAQRGAIFAQLQPEASLVANLGRQAVTGAPLGGVPYVVKDLFPVAGYAARGGSAFLAEHRSAPISDGALVRELGVAGGTFVGTTHLHEFAYGLTGENAHFGDVSHPRFPDRTSGGSSSGSAAAVAAGVVPLGIGTDTGGSIRVPAAFCGLYGLRLTPHHRWIADAFPLAQSFDTAGWFTQSAEDMVAATDALIGLRSSDRPLRGVYVGFDDWVQADTEVAEALAVRAARLAPVADRTTRDELLRGFRGNADAYSVLQSVEAYAIHRKWLDSLQSSYSPEVWQRIDRGRRWSESQIQAARNTLASVQLLWARFFLTFDFLVLPATPFPALRKADCTLENRTRLLTLTTPASLGGLPVLTIPVPLASGLSSGLQVVVNNALSPAIRYALEQA